MLLLVCVAVNASLLGCYLSRPLLLRLRRLRSGFARSRRYFACRMSETRERAFRGRTLLLAGALADTVAWLALLAAGYLPSLALAHYQSHWRDALYSAEAIAGMALAALFCTWRLSRP